MPEINQLTALDELSGGDLFPVFSQSNGDARKVAASTLLAYLLANLSTSGNMETQYAAPAATGSNTTIAPSENGNSVYLNYTPLAGYAAATITLPPVANCQDGQEVLVSTTQAVTTLTVAGNGATAVNGAPTTLAANAFFRLRFIQPTATWQRVG